MDPLGKKENLFIGVSSQDEQMEKIVKGLAGKIGPSSIEALKQGHLTSRQIDNIHKRLDQIVVEGEQLFGKSGSLSNTKVQEFVMEKFSGVIASLVETLENQAPDLIRHADLSEAVFSHKGDYHPLLVTDSLATCIGVAGYDPTNQFGFVVHFTCEAEIIASGTMLLDRIRAYRTHGNAPLLIHLRGGIKDMSEPLLVKVKEWLRHEDLKSIIASEDTLQFPIAPGIGLPKVPGSIKLDVRTGACETYDRETNPYSNEKKGLSEINSNFCAEFMTQVVLKKSEIKIAYDSKAP